MAELADGATGPIAPPPARGTARETFRVALRLGLTSFGGPIAHVGYFRREYVERRGWLDEQAFGDLVALCQSLPGPASSQLGIAIGTRRAGMLGGLTAWLGFTLPSAVAMTLFAPRPREGAAVRRRGDRDGCRAGGRRPVTALGGQDDGAPEWARLRSVTLDVHRHELQDPLQPRGTSGRGTHLHEAGGLVGRVGRSSSRRGSPGPGAPVSGGMLPSGSARQ